MPELPEVETIVRELNRALSGKKLTDFLVFDRERIIRPRLVLPLKITSVKRRGKYLICNTDRGTRCLLHLRMTGGLLLEQRTGNGEDQMAKHKHERARFHFHDGSLLRFVDVRRFGTIDWLDGKRRLPELGQDPLSKSFTAKSFSAALGRSSRAIKSLLLDQRVVAGIGNIYADESLWFAGVDPRRRSNTLNKVEARKLVSAAKSVLRRAIEKRGFTLRDYRRIDGSTGSYQRVRKVYGREGERCPRFYTAHHERCRGKIKKTKVGGRSSYFCPKCQK